MLRHWVIGVGIGLLLLAAALLLTGHRDGGFSALAIWGVILAGGVYCERYVYKPDLSRPPGAGWVRTEEKTVDADGVVTVWFNPTTGERAYIRQPAG